LCDKKVKPSFLFVTAINVLNTVISGTADYRGRLKRQQQSQHVSSPAVSLSTLITNCKDEAGLKKKWQDEVLVFWLESPENIPVQSRIKNKERLQKIFPSKLRLRTKQENITLGQPVFFSIAGC